MNKLISELILYSNIEENSFLYKLCEIYADWNELQAWEASGVNAEDLEYPGADLTGELRGRLYKEIKHLLDVSTDYGFNGNLWQNYLTFFILSNENSFSVTCEGEGATDGGSINLLALHDFKIFKELFHFDFGPLEAALGTDCLSTVCHYQAIPKKDKLYNKDVSGIVTKVSENIAGASTEQEIFDIVTAHYKSYGVGLFGINRAFRISGSGDELQFVPISNASPVLLSDLVGYERQKKELMDNTAAFCQGLSANNVLLYGE
ncbi:MAG: DUF815 domain-containing protein, partial [Parasporobacterium sp.]|nr:DUF815 domain-containing protein [Parasporobacterium sp.]